MLASWSTGHKVVRHTYFNRLQKNWSIETHFSQVPEDVPGASRGSTEGGQGRRQRETELGKHAFNHGLWVECFKIQGKGQIGHCKARVSFTNP